MPLLKDIKMISPDCDYLLRINEIPGDLLKKDGFFSDLQQFGENFEEIQKEGNLFLVYLEGDSEPILMSLEKEDIGSDRPERSLASLDNIVGGKVESFFPFSADAFSFGAHSGIIPIGTFSIGTSFPLTFCVGEENHTDWGVFTLREPWKDYPMGSLILKNKEGSNEGENFYVFPPEARKYVTPLP